MKQCLAVLAATILTGAASAAEEPQYDKDVQPFLKSYCIECHRGPRAKARVNLESYESLMKASRRGQPMVIPGEPDKSRLLHTLEGKAKRMPPRRYAHQPTAEEVKLLREWVAAGAKKAPRVDTEPTPKSGPSAGWPNRLEGPAKEGTAPGQPDTRQQGSLGEGEAHAEPGSARGSAGASPSRPAALTTCPAAGACTCYRWSGRPTCSGRSAS